MSSSVLGKFPTPRCHGSAVPRLYSQCVYCFPSCASHWSLFALSIRSISVSPSELPAYTLQLCVGVMLLGLSYTPQHLVSLHFIIWCKSQQHRAMSGSSSASALIYVLREKSILVDSLNPKDQSQNSLN